MSKYNQIQARLKEMDGGSFQRLADAYLHKKGYERLNPFGSVIGVDKVRSGTPDSYISLTNGKYVFAQHTTQAKGLITKLKSDLESCFDTSKTGVPTARIQEIVFCFNSTLSPEDYDVLREMCQQRKVNLSLFGIGPIALDLYQHYHDLTKDFLGLEVDTGQILNPDEFVATYNKGALATPLDTPFHFRNTEMETSLRQLEDSDVLIISGKAGIGKSRLALECCSQFSSDRSEWKVYCISNRGPNIFEDLRVHFAEPAKYLIMVDDANRINRFEYVLQLLIEQRPGRRIKVVSTVRDYALQSIKQVAKPFGKVSELVLAPLTDKEIKDLVENLFEITNPLYLERIARVSGGNPRLAVMAAGLAKRTNNLQSIGNVSELYDQYYASMRAELSDLGDPLLLKSAGIVAFYRILDYSDKKTLIEIEQAFGIRIDQFWKAVRRLHELEIFDMYENEVVRVSDQILSTYLFYLVFFRDKVLDFAILLNHFFPRFREKLLDALNPVIDAFYGDYLLSVMRPAVDEAWDEAMLKHDEQSLLHLMDTFFFLKGTDVLLYIRNTIQEIQNEVSAPSEEIDDTHDADLKSPSILSVLSHFRYMEIDLFNIALELVLDFVEKRPQDISQVSYVLVKRYGFSHRSYANDFITQRSVVEALVKRSQLGANPLFTKLFLYVAKQFLPLEYHTTESKGGREIDLITFSLPAIASLFRLRSIIFNGLTDLFRLEESRDIVLDVLEGYSSYRYDDGSNDILRKDSESLIPLIRDEFDRANPRHCIIAQHYFDTLERSKFNIDESLKREFRTDVVEVSELLTEDHLKKEYRDLSYDQYLLKRKETIREYLRHHDAQRLRVFVDQCTIASLIVQDNHEQWQCGEGFALSIVAICDLNSAYLIETVDYYLSIGDPLNVEPSMIIDKLNVLLGKEDTRSFLQRHSFPAKIRWLFCFYALLKPPEITEDSVSQLIDLYRNSGLGQKPHHLDYLLNYEALAEGTVVQIIRIVLTQAQENPLHARALSMLFNPNTKLSKQLPNLFTGKIGLLKQTYLAVLEVDLHIDHDRQIMSSIMTLDSRFIMEYIDWVYERRKWPSKYDDIHDYSFLWLRTDYRELLTDLIDHIYQKEKELSYASHNYLETFFNLRTDDASKANPTVKSRQDKVIADLIKSRGADQHFIQFLFWIVTEFDGNRRRAHVADFLATNKNFDHFKELPIESRSWSATGSLVPGIQQRIEYLQSLIPILNSVDLLQHRHLVEQQIENLRVYIESEKKKDFMDH